MVVVVDIIMVDSSRKCIVTFVIYSTVYYWVQIHALTMYTFIVNNNIKYAS